MKLLLDTHIWVWGFAEQAKLSRRVRQHLSDRGNELWLSPISIWEVILLQEKGRLEPRADAAALLQTASSTLLREAAITREVALETGNIRLPHRDPADLFLVATARVYELTLVTADERLLNSRSCSMLSNL